MSYASVFVAVVGVVAFFPYTKYFFFSRGEGGNPNEYEKVSTAPKIKLENKVRD